MTRIIDLKGPDGNAFALSRRGEREICSHCGKREAMEDVMNRG